MMLLLSALIGLSLFQSTLAGQAARPSVQGDFPDPSIIHAGGLWWAFATNAGGSHVQVATSNDFNNWIYKGGYDALPRLPAWVSRDRPDVWAPNVVQITPERFVMYFAAATNWNQGLHCVGTAVASSVGGPYNPSDDLFACDQIHGGAIDPSGFLDPQSGRRYVAYKVDGNSLGEGGPCGNEISPLPTPILLQQVSWNGVTKIGEPIQILDRSDSDGPLIEAPSLAFMGGRYFLFFSSNCYNTDLYDQTFAVSDSLTGPYIKRGPLLVTGDLDLRAPGGGEVTPDGQLIAFHVGPVGQRSMYTGRIQYNGGTGITICVDRECISAS